MNEGGSNSSKRAAAIHAIQEIEDGMVVGLGSGSTAAYAMEALARRVHAGLRVVGIPTSRKTAELARHLGISLTDFSKHRRVDVAIDGADEVEQGTLNLIKGLGGALLREKIVAAAADQMIVVVDESKIVGRLGAQTALPVEIVSFGWQTVVDRLNEAGLSPRLRRSGETGLPFVTDGGNYIADCSISHVADVAALDRRLATVIGVVEIGFFFDLASKVIVGGSEGVTILQRRESRIP